MTQLSQKGVGGGIAAFRVPGNKGYCGRSLGRATCQNFFVWSLEFLSTTFFLSTPALVGGRYLKRGQSSSSLPPKFRGTTGWERTARRLDTIGSGDWTPPQRSCQPQVPRTGLVAEKEKKRRNGRSWGLIGPERVSRRLPLSLLPAFTSVSRPIRNLKPGPAQPPLSRTATL